MVDIVIIKLRWLANWKIWDSRSVSNGSTLCTQSFVVLRCELRKPWGFLELGELITTRRTTRVAFRNPPSGSKNTLLQFSYPVCTRLLIRWITVICMLWWCLDSRGMGVSDTFSESDVAGAEWQWRHRTCVDGPEWRERWFSEWGGGWRWFSVYRFICWAAPPHSLGSTAFHY